MINIFIIIFIHFVHFLYIRNIFCTCLPFFKCMINVFRNFVSNVYIFIKDMGHEGNYSQVIVYIFLTYKYKYICIFQIYTKQGWTGWTAMGQANFYARAAPNRPSPSAELNSPRFDLPCRQSLFGNTVEVYK